MKRVLLISIAEHSLANRLTANIMHCVDALTQLDYTVDLLTLPLGTPPAIPGVRTICTVRLPFIRTLPRKAPFRCFCYSKLIACYAFFLALHNRYQIVQGFDQANPIALRAGRLVGAHVIFAFDRAKRDCEYTQKKKQKINAVKGILCRRLHKCDAIVTNDALIEEKLKTGHYANRLCVVPEIPALAENISTAVIRNIRQRFTKDNQPFIITFAGFLKGSPSSEILLRAMPLIRQKQHNAHFIFIGGNHDDIAKWQPWLLQAGITTAVATFLAELPLHETIEIMAASDLLIAPRTTDFGPDTSLLDYMVTGIPVVAIHDGSRTPSLPAETVLFTSANANALAESVLELGGNQARRLTLGANGLEHVRHNHSFAALKEAYRHCYEYVQRRQ